MPKPRGLAGKARLERRMRRWDVARKTLGWGGLGASVGGAGAGIGGVPHASWIALAGMAALAGKGSLERRLLKQAIGRPLLARRLREKFKGLEYTDTALRLIEHLGPMGKAEREKLAKQLFRARLWNTFVDANKFAGEERGRMAGKVMDVVDAVQEFSEALGVDRTQAREMSEHLMDMLPRMRVGQRTTLQIAANPGGPDFGLNIARTVRGYRILNLPKPK